MTNSAISLLLDEAADLLEIDGANAFRIRAYRNAARVWPNSNDRWRPTPANWRLTPPPRRDRQGPATKIGDIVRGGTFAQLEELRAKIPAGARDMLRTPRHRAQKGRAVVPGTQGRKPRPTGPSRAGREGRRAQGVRREDGRRSLTAWRTCRPRPGGGTSPRPAVAEELAAFLRPFRGLTKWSPRSAVAARKLWGPRPALHCVRLDRADGCACRAPQVETVLSRGETKMRVRLSIASKWICASSPPNPSARLCSISPDRRSTTSSSAKWPRSGALRVNEYGVFRGEERIAGRTRKSLPDAGTAVGPPGTPRGPPGVRVGRAGTVPRVGPRQRHSGRPAHAHDRHDGEATIAEMIEAALARGRSTSRSNDHSKRVTVANGLDARVCCSLEEHRRGGREVSEHPRSQGIECDILEDATLDLPDDVLSEADWVIAVLHFGLRQTERGDSRPSDDGGPPSARPHDRAPTARIVGKRPPVPIRWDEFLKAVADHGKLLEINANPARLDLDDVRAAQARDRGIKLVLNTDAHSQRGMDVMPWGVVQKPPRGVARMRCGQHVGPGGVRTIDLGKPVILNFPQAWKSLPS